MAVDESAIVRAPSSDGRPRVQRDVGMKAQRVSAGERKLSAGILLYRRPRGAPEVLLVHPGGPFWAKKDLGAWSIPKGEPSSGEDLLAAAKREFHEETGLAVSGVFHALAPVRQPGGKIVHAWAVEGDGDAATNASNSFTMEWPPRSGRMREFPEVDHAEWFDLAAAAGKITKGQVDLIDQLARLVQPRSAGRNGR
jgi:predicted NUDIX family NTP pyrophosphohydrolase